MKITRFKLIAVLSIGLLWFGVPVSRATDLYVAANGTGGGTSWADATNSLQGAINAIDGTYTTNTVWVSNGVYNTGGVTNYPPGGLLTNRVAIWKKITVRSANNDPANTIIRGRFNSGEPDAPDTVTNGPAAIRCVYMTNNSSLIGFTVTNGATLTGNTEDGYGGGITAQRDTTISNCVVANNAADYAGGGVYNGRMYNCTIDGNETMSSGGGGASFTIMYNCRVINNSALGEGGGLAACELYSCLIAGNSAARGGGGKSTVATACTFVGNRAWEGNTNYGGGTKDCTLTDCIVRFNRAAAAGINISDSSDGTRVYTCASSFSAGDGNILTDPQFITNPTGSGTNYVAGDYHLRNNSPSINTGTNQSWMTNSYDLDGRTRIRYGRVDMGAYETIYDGTMFTIP